jgi:hypothetical protein
VIFNGNGGEWSVQDVLIVRNDLVLTNNATLNQNVMIAVFNSNPSLLPQLP